MMAKYRITLVCGHMRHAFYPFLKSKHGYFCGKCNCLQKQNIKVPAERIQVGVSSI